MIRHTCLHINYTFIFSAYYQFVLFNISESHGNILCRFQKSCIFFCFVLFWYVFFLVMFRSTHVYFPSFVAWTICCTPYIIDSPSSINTRQRERQTGARQWCTSPVVGSHFGRPCCALHSFGQVPQHWTYLWPKGTVPPALTLFGGVWLIARCMRRPF